MFLTQGSNPHLLHFRQILYQLSNKRSPRILESVKNLPANAGDAGLIPGLGISPGGGNGNPFQYSYLRNPMDRRSLAGYSS